MGITVSLDGIKGLQDAINKIDKTLQKGVADEINASALNIQSGAKRLAPVNFGQLRNSIALEKISELTYAVDVKASYGAYVEFGTGGKVSVPSEFSKYAESFIGKSKGTFADFIKALTLWVERKGIGDRKKAKSTAYAIALSILRNGMRPQPYLIPTYQAEKPKLINRIKTLLNAQS